MAAFAKCPPSVQKIMQRHIGCHILGFTPASHVTLMLLLVFLNIIFIVPGLATSRDDRLREYAVYFGSAAQYNTLLLLLPVNRNGIVPFLGFSYEEVVKFHRCVPLCRPFGFFVL